eukprot:g6921.t1
MECFVVKLQDPQGQFSKDFLLYPGIPEGEVHQAIEAAFSLQQLQVAGLYHATLDVYVPIALFSKAPQYFSKGAPYRVVGVAAIGRDQERVDDDCYAMSRSSLESVLRQLFWADTATQEEISGATRTGTLVDRFAPGNTTLPMNPGLAELRIKMGLCSFPAEEVLDSLHSTAASDGKLTRAEFDGFLKEKADLLGITTLSTATQIFQLFDEAGGGILHITDLAAGLAVLCDGSFARSVRYACRLYRGPGGDAGFLDIYAFALSIFKVLRAAASTGDWAWPGMLLHELSAMVSSDFLVQKGLPLSGRVNFDEWFAATFPRSFDRNIGGDWAALFRCLRKHEVHGVLELLSTFVDDHGGVSLPAFLGCMRALFEVDGQSILNDAEKDKLKILLKQLFDALDDNRRGTRDVLSTVPLKDLVSGISTFCGKHDKAKARTVLDMYGNEEGSISEEGARKFLTAVFKALLQVGNRSTMEDVDPQDLAYRTTADAFRSVALRPDGTMGLEEFHRWHSSSIELLLPLILVEESADHYSSDETMLAALDVEEVHRIFKLRDIDAARFINDLNAIACDGIVSWTSFLRYMCGLANTRPLTEESRAAIAMAKKLFNIYDEGKQKEIELRALVSGLAVLCNGCWKDRVAALFSLLDTERRGSLSRGDMHTYFSSTFKLLGSMQPCIGAAADANVLAEKAVVEAFKTGRDEVVPERERFSEHMLAALYSKMDWKGAAEDTSESTLSETLERARRDTQLCNASVAHMSGVLKDALNDQGRLTRPAVHRCVRHLRETVRRNGWRGEANSHVGGKATAGEPKHNSDAAEDVLDRLFDAFDVYNEGDVDFFEFTSALSVLCGGTREEKMHSIFNLFHHGERGWITTRDIATYTTSAFRAMYKLQPCLDGEVGITPEALGNVTASKMIEEMSANGDGRISPRDFGWWLSDEGNSSNIMRSTAEGFGCNAPGDDTDVEEEAQGHGEVQREEGNVHAGLWGDQLDGQGHVVMRARKLLCLDCFNVNDLVEILAESEVMGSLSLDDFWRCICYVLQLGGTRDGTAEWDEAFLLTERLHRAFEDTDGVVAFAAITCGLSILCPSTVEEKILVAFVLFDKDGDGKLAFEEAKTYITSVLRVVRALGQDATAIADPDELGAALTTQCFSQAQLPVDGKLGIDDFRLFAQ